MPPPPVMHQSTPVQPSYSSYDHPRPSSNSSRSSMPCVRSSTPQTVCAPKVDFLPDFNSAPLRHQSHQENPLRRSTTQQLYVPPGQPLPSHHANNTAPLPHMSTFKKRPLPTSPLYDGLTIPPPPTSSLSTSASLASSSYVQANDSPRFSKYPSMMDPSQRLAPPTLPAQDYPSDPSKYYLTDSRAKYDQQFSQRERMPLKRAGEQIYSGSPSKQSRLAWHVPSATDKQTVKPKLSVASTLSEQQKRQEMSLPVPLPNGALHPLASGTYDQRSDGGSYSVPESSRYQPAYCDKRTYSESKAIRSSPSSYNPVISKSMNAHSLPQQLSGTQQPTYPNYRQPAQKTCLPSGTSGGQPMDQPSNTGADKRVLSLLRNSLENKQQRDEQLNSQQPILVNHSQQSFQNKVHKIFYKIQRIFKF